MSLMRVHRSVASTLPMWQRCSAARYFSFPCLVSDAFHTVPCRTLYPTKTYRSNQRYYSKYEEAKQKPQRKLKIFIIVIVSGIVGLHSMSLLARRRHKKINDHKADSNDIHKDTHCKGQSGTLSRIGQFWLPSEFFKEKKKILQIGEFACRKDDIIVASFPKSGTTWIQEIVYMIMSNNEQSENSTIEERFPYLEYVYPGLKALAQSASPRYLKTHLPYELLPLDIRNGNSKVIYIARNAKDVSVSYYHFIKMLTITRYSGRFEDFFRSFLDGKVAYGPWSEHVLQYWNKRDQLNVFFVTYEDLQKEPVSVIKQLASFLEKPVSNRQAVEIAHHCSFNQMASNPLVNYRWWDDLGIRDTNASPFMRKGKVGDWVNYYTLDMTNQIDSSVIEKTEQVGLSIRDK